MNTTQVKSGRISEHSHGLGTVDREMVEQRARELAVINGRENQRFTEEDWQQARRELLGQENLEEPPPEETLKDLTKWDERPGLAGERVESRPPSDEQTVAERLTREGVEEANHDLMLKGSRDEANRSKD